jgi:hypothetical protein
VDFSKGKARRNRGEFCEVAGAFAEVRQCLVSFRALGLGGVHHSLAMEFFVECDRSFRSREPIGITGCGLQLDFSPRSETSIFGHREAEIHFVPFARIIATKAAGKSPSVGFGSKPFEALVANDRGPAIAVLNDRNFRVVGWLHWLPFRKGRSGSVRWAYFLAKISGRQAAPAARYSPLPAALDWLVLAVLNQSIEVGAAASSSTRETARFATAQQKETLPRRQ